MGGLSGLFDRLLACRRLDGPQAVLVVLMLVLVLMVVVVVVVVRMEAAGRVVGVGAQLGARAWRWLAAAKTCAGQLQERRRQIRLLVAVGVGTQK